MFKTSFVFALFLVGLVQCATVFDITKYGGKGDGTHKNTEAIAKAIDAAHSAGGTVHFPKGHYLTGPIHFKSNVHLELDEGTVIKFSDDFHDYTPMTQVHSDGILKMGFVPLISAEKVSKISITGKGTLDGSGAKWWKLRKHYKDQHKGETHKAVNLDHVKKVEDLLDKSGNLINDISPPKFFVPHQSDHVTLDGVSFINSPFITIYPTFTDYITINKVNVNNPHDAPNTDGIDPDSCRHVTISHCTVSVGDDCLAIKSTKSSGVAKPSENITVNDCVMHSGHGGFVIGSTTAGGIKDIHVRNMHFEGTDRGIRIKTAKGHGGVIQNIHIQNVTMKGITHEGITINALYEGTKEPNAGTGEVPEIRDIFIQDVTGDAKLGIEISGLPEKHFNNIQLKNVHIVTDKAIHISNADKVVQDHVTVGKKA